MRIEQGWVKYVTFHVKSTETFLRILCEELNHNSSLAKDISALKEKEDTHNSNISLL